MHKCDCGLNGADGSSGLLNPSVHFSLTTEEAFMLMRWDVKHLKRRNRHAAKKTLASTAFIRKLIKMVVRSSETQPSRRVAALFSMGLSARGR